MSMNKARNSSKSPSRNSEEKENKEDARADLLQVGFDSVTKQPVVTIAMFRCS